MLILVFVLVLASVLVFILDNFLRRNNTLGGDMAEFEKAKCKGKGRKVHTK